MQTMNPGPRQTGLRRVPIEQLREDVHFLGRVLGRVLREQHGQSFLDLVEDIRLRAIWQRTTTATVSLQPLADAVDGLNHDEMFAVSRAFSLYFYLINAAEERRAPSASYAGERTQELSSAAA